MKLITLTGPSGVGKDTLVDLVVEHYPNLFAKARSHTTRARRLNESESNYIFVGVEDFLTIKKSGGFIEDVNYAGNLYGISQAELREISDQQRVPIVIVEKNGLDQIKLIPNLEVFSFFLLPSLGATQVVLQMSNRGDSEEAIKKRMTFFEDELSDMTQYDCVIHSFLSRPDVAASDFVGQALSNFVAAII